MPFRILTALIAGLFCTFLGGWTLLKNPRGSDNRSFALFNIPLAIWNFAELIVYINDNRLALVLYRFCYVAGSFIAFCFLRFLFSILKWRISWPYLVIKWLSFIFAAISTTGLIIKDIKFSHGQFSPITEIPGPYYDLFIFFFIASLAYGLLGLILSYRKSSGAIKNQLRYIAFAICLGIIALVIFIGNQIKPNIPPVHYLVEMGITSLFAYAIIKHRLVDVQLLGRNATGWFFSGVLVILPFATAAFIAHLFWTWPHFVASSSGIILFCAILNFSLVLTTLTFLHDSHARRLCLFFILLGICNLSDLILFMPQKSFSLVLYRLSLGTAFLALWACFAYWRGYFFERNSFLAKITSWIPASVWIGALFGGLSPFVLKSLMFDSLQNKPAVEVPGPAHWFFTLWFLATGLTCVVWPFAAWWKSREEGKQMIGFWMFGSFILAIATSMAYFLFVEGKSPWYLYPIFEFAMCLFLIGSLIWRLPLEDGGTRQSLALRIGSLAIFTLATPLFVGFLYAQHSQALIFLDGALFLAAVGFLMWKIQPPVQKWVDQTFVFRKEFGHIARAKEVVQKEWNLDSLEEALPLVTREVLETTPYRACTIAIMFDDQPKRPFFRSTQLRLAQGELIQGIPWSESLVLAFLQMIRQKGNLVLREDVADLPSLVQNLDPLLFEAAVPLRTDGKIVGMVVMGPKKGKKTEFHSEDLNILTTLAQTLSRRLGPSVGLNLFRCIVNNNLHDVLGHDIGPLVDQLSMGYPITPDMTVQGLRKVREVLKDLRSYAQGELERGRVREPDPTDMAGLLKGIYNLHKVSAENKGIEFRLKIPEALPRPRLDPTLMERCIANLVTNAIKYTVRGSIELSVQPGDKFVVVAVADTGIGIPKESLDLIFEPGYRVSGEAMRIAEGTGIGLANVQEIMAAMGGRVSVKSEPGKGSQFYLHFPLPAAVTEIKAATA